MCGTITWNFSTTIPKKFSTTKVLLLPDDNLAW